MVVLGVGLVLIAVMPAYARGFTAGVVVSVWLGLVAYAVIQFSGSAGLLMGVLGAEQVLSEAQVQQCWQALAEHARTRDEREPLPASASTLAVRAAAGVAGGLVAVVALAGAGRVLDSISGWLCAVTAAAVAGLVGRRWAWLRVVSSGGLIGVAVVCVYVAAALARPAITQ